MKKPALIAIAIAVVFGVVFAAFGFIAPHLWNSPDETAVAYFVKSFLHFLMYTFIKGELLYE